MQLVGSSAVAAVQDQTSVMRDPYCFIFFFLSFFLLYSSYLMPRHTGSLCASPNHLSGTLAFYVYGVFLAQILVI
jgi:hypothetical protein